jgi:hypothetical protein
VSRPVPAEAPEIDGPADDLRVRLQQGRHRPARQAVDEYHPVITMGYRETGSLTPEGLEQVKRRDADTIQLFRPTVAEASEGGLLRRRPERQPAGARALRGAPD